MAESNDDKLARVRAMARGDSDTWDLSRNDVAALRYTLALLDASQADKETALTKLHTLSTYTEAVGYIDGLSVDPIMQAIDARTINLRASLARAEGEAAELRACRIAYASEFAPDTDGEPDVGSIHANIRKTKADLAAARAEVEAVRQERDEVRGRFVDRVRAVTQLIAERDSARSGLARVTAERDGLADRLSICTCGEVNLTSLYASLDSARFLAAGWHRLAHVDALEAEVAALRGEIALLTRAHCPACACSERQGAA
jgi:hypothetical protein